MINKQIHKIYLITKSNRMRNFVIFLIVIGLCHCQTIITNAYPEYLDQNSTQLINTTTSLNKQTQVVEPVTATVNHNTIKPATQPITDNDTKGDNSSSISFNSDSTNLIISNNNNQAISTSASTTTSNIQVNINQITIAPTPTPIPEQTQPPTGYSPIPVAPISLPTPAPTPTLIPAQEKEQEQEPTQEPTQAQATQAQATHMPAPVKKPPTAPVKPPAKFTYCGRATSARRKRFPTQPNPRGRQRLVATNYGFDMFIDSKDSTVSSSIAISGTWQPNYINLIGHIVKEGNNVLNLGSQSGLEALIMGKIVGPTGKLFIFEPYSFSNKLVTKNIKLNNLQNITTIYKYGASDKKTKAVIQVAYYNTGGSEIVAARPTKPANRRRGQFNEEQQVQLDRVDALLPPDVALDFALLDVEKMEIKALQGMKGIIERSLNLIIMTEWQYARNPRRNKEATLELLRYMVERGYKIYSYSGGNFVSCTMGKFHEFGRIEDLLKVDFLDIFFIPKDYDWQK